MMFVYASVKRLIKMTFVLMCLVLVIPDIAMAGNAQICNITDTAPTNCRVQDIDESEQVIIKIDPTQYGNVKKLTFKAFSNNSTEPAILKAKNPKTAEVVNSEKFIIESKKTGKTVIEKGQDGLKEYELTGLAPWSEITLEAEDHKVDIDDTAQYFNIEYFQRSD